MLVVMADQRTDPRRPSTRANVVSLPLCVLFVLCGYSLTRFDQISNSKSMKCQKCFAK